MNRFLNLFFIFLILTLSAVNIEAKSGGYSGGGYKSTSIPTKTSSINFFSTQKTVTKQATPTLNKPTYGANYTQQSEQKPVIKADSFQQVKLEAERKKASKLALESFRAKQQELKQPEAAKKIPQVTIPILASTRYKERLSTPDHNYSSNVNRRVNYYENRNYNPPNYLRNAGGSWGGLDGFFLGYIVNDIFSPNSHSSEYMYHNQNDPGVTAYMNELRRQSVDNAELRDKISELDKQMAVLKTNGVVQQPGYAPEGVDPDIMYSKEYVDSHKSEFYNKGQDTPSSESDDESGHSGLIFTTILLIMGFGVWFVFFRRT